MKECIWLFYGRPRCTLQMENLVHTHDHTAHTEIDTSINGKLVLNGYLLDHENETQIPVHEKKHISTAT